MAWWPVMFILTGKPRLWDAHHCYSTLTLVVEPWQGWLLSVGSAKLILDIGVPVP